MKLLTVLLSHHFNHGRWNHYSKSFVSPPTSPSWQQLRRRAMRSLCIKNASAAHYFSKDEFQLTMLIGGHFHCISHIQDSFSYVITPCSEKSPSVGPRDCAIKLPNNYNEREIRWLKVIRIYRKKCIPDKLYSLKQDLYSAKNVIE